jgi:uncharacterized protein (DUF58 family)
MRLAYRSHPLFLVLLLVVVAAALTTGALTGYLAAASAIAGVLVLAWLFYALRIRRPLPSGPGPRRGSGGDDDPAGGAGVREPRRPIPQAPAGAAALPLDGEAA